MTISDPNITGRVCRADQIIRGYETLLLHSARMLKWAHSSNWQALIDEETRYVEQVNRLAMLEEGAMLHEKYVWRKHELLERILEQSLEVKSYLAAQRSKLDGMIQDIRHRHDLIDKYLDWGINGSADHGGTENKS